jgi:hypothetical protein
MQQLLGYITIVVVAAAAVAALVFRRFRSQRGRRRARADLTGIIHSDLRK